MAGQSRPLCVLELPSSEKADSLYSIQGESMHDYSKMTL